MNHLNPAESTATTAEATATTAREITDRDALVCSTSQVSRTCARETRRPIADMLASVKSIR